MSSSLLVYRTVELEDAPGTGALHGTENGALHH